MLAWWSTSSVVFHERLPVRSVSKVNQMGWVGRMEGRGWWRKRCKCHDALFAAAVTTAETSVTPRRCIVVPTVDGAQSNSLFCKRSRGPSLGCMRWESLKACEAPHTRRPLGSHAPQHCLSCCKHKGVEGDAQA